MIGEANMATGKARFGYDATLNQMARGRISHKCGAIDFPYTFVAKDTLEKIMQQYLGRPSARKEMCIRDSAKSVVLHYHLPI